MIDQTYTIIGDVHGHVRPLAAALADAESRGDVIIYVGDYVNVGPETVGTLELLVDATARLGERLILLRGNHDQALLDFLLDASKTAFLRIGGLATIKSYYPDPPGDVIERFRETFPTSHMALLEDTRTHYESDKFLVSHCGYDPGAPNTRTPETMVLGSFPTIFEAAVGSRPRRLVVCGHYVQRDGTPFIGSGLICLDTGVGYRPGAKLAAFRLPSQELLSYA